MRSCSARQHSSITHDRSEAREVQPRERAGLHSGFDVVHEPVGSSLHNERNVVFVVPTEVLDEFSKNDVGGGRSEGFRDLVHLDGSEAWPETRSPLVDRLDRVSIRGFSVAR